MVKLRHLNKGTRSLLRELVITDFKLRYQGSLLGYLWSLIRPLALFTVLYVVFAHFFRFGQSIPHFPAYLLLGIVLWTFFVEATQAGMHSIVNRGDLIRKVSLSKHMIVVSTSISALINLVINLFIVAVFMVAGGTDVRWTILLVPFLILELFILSMAISFLLAALFVKYRDVAYVWEVALQVLFYAVPIIYPLGLVPARFVSFILVNPVAQIIQDMRYVVIAPQTMTVLNSQPKYVFLFPVLIVLTLTVAAANYFKKSSINFAENL